MKNKAIENRSGTCDTAKKIGISPERLRYWEQQGIVNPEYVQCGTRRFRQYSAEDIRKASLVKDLVEREKYTLEGAIKKMTEVK